MLFKNRTMVTNYWKCISVILVFLIPVIASDNQELREIKYDNGQIKERCYVKLDAQGTYVRDGLCTKWYPSGKKESDATYKDGNPDGIATVWYENGKKKNETTFKNKKLEGTLTEWYENGNKKSESTYKNGLLGKSTSWYESGKKEGEFTDKDGKQDGVTTLWYENGNKKSETSFKNGVIDGKSISWYESGEKESEAIFKDGKQEGIATIWYESGEKKTEVTFKDGKPVAQNLSKKGVFKLYQLCKPDTVATILDTLNRYVFTGDNNFQKYLIAVGDQIGIEDKDYALLSNILKSDNCKKVLQRNLESKYLILFDHASGINNSRIIYFVNNNAVLNNCDIDKVDNTFYAIKDEQFGECNISLKPDSKVKLFNYTKTQVDRYFAISIDSDVYTYGRLTKAINSLQITPLAPTVATDLKQLLSSSTIDEKH